MEMTPGMRVLTEQSRALYGDAESIIHQWGHIMRTTRGAVWVIDVVGGSVREQQLAYVAGILHDCVRPVTEEICHARVSGEKARSLLESYPEFTPHEKQAIVKAIQDHRKPVAWESRVHQSVYLSDKIFEHMGAYLDFRASVWTGELSRTDFKGMTPLEAVIEYYTAASSKFLTGIFPRWIQKIVEYQLQWNRTFLSALTSNQKWAVEMAENLVDAGMQGKEFEQILASFIPRGTEQEKWAREMEKYIRGDLLTYFKELLY